MYNVEEVTDEQERNIAQTQMDQDGKNFIPLLVISLFRCHYCLLIIIWGNLFDIMNILILTAYLYVIAK